MNVLLLMSGEGSRFTKAGYTTKKPLIPIPYNNKVMPLFQATLENIYEHFSETFSINNLVVVSRSEYDIGDIVSSFCKEKGISKYTVINVKETTEGALCSALLAKDYLSPFEPLLISNADQLIFFNKTNFKTLYNQGCGLCGNESNNYIFTFKPTDNSSAWSFARVDDYNRVLETKEKVKISDIATCGWYFFTDVEEFLGAAKRQKTANDRYNNEFYLCPVYNYVGEASYIFDTESFIGLGTPEQLEKYEVDISLKAIN